jgi:hypothetical protein
MRAGAGAAVVSPYRGVGKGASRARREGGAAGGWGKLMGGVHLLVVCVREKGCGVRRRWVGLHLLGRFAGHVGEVWRCGSWAGVV